MGTRPKRKLASNTDPTVTRVEIEFSDGRIARLTGEQAHQWNQACIGAIGNAYVHGCSFPEFKWDTFQKA